jgi:hypothetical protein
LNNIRFIVLPAPAPSPGGKTEMPAAENVGLRLSVDQRLEREFRRGDLAGEMTGSVCRWNPARLGGKIGDAVSGRVQTCMPLLLGERM